MRCLHWVLESHRAFIVEQIKRTSHLTLHGLKDMLAARRVKVSHVVVRAFPRREGLRFKKRALFTLEQARAERIAATAVHPPIPVASPHGQLKEMQMSTTK